MHTLPTDSYAEKRSNAGSYGHGASPVVALSKDDVLMPNAGVHRAAANQVSSSKPRGLRLRVQRFVLLIISAVVLL
jgi:hypothetical protein